jgi:probable rRNA maturation factor
MDTTTDVLSFDLSDEFEPKPSFALIVNAAMAARQATERGHSAQAELALYITHGLLHNLGYDDLDDEQALQMHRMEDHILERHGFGRVFFDEK